MSNLVRTSSEKLHTDLQTDRNAHNNLYEQPALETQRTDYFVATLNFEDACTACGWSRFHGYSILLTLHTAPPRPLTHPSLSKLIPLSPVELASFQMDYFLIMPSHLNRERRCGRHSVFLFV